MDPQLRRISKLLSFVLRHHPEELGLTVDEAGWVEVDELLAAAARSGRGFSRALLQRVVAENDKRRFSFDEDGTRIRANQGHSIAVDLALEPVEPPEVLFHGTVERFLESIGEEGLRPGSRRHVHLSADVATAKNVGSRRGRPVVLTIDAARMQADGHVFFLSANGVWLVDHVPVEYVTFP